MGSFWRNLLLNKSVTARDFMKVWPYSDPPTSESYWFEKIDMEAELEFAMNNWQISIYASVIYLAFIFGGRNWMKNRKPFDLRLGLVLWNFGLAFFSTFAFCRSVPDLFQILISPNGFFRSVCVREHFNESSAFYAYLFLWSKLLELGDTGFIVLRKRPLLFLHWFHHITVLMACWMTVFHFDPVARWFGIVNLGVHSVMYTYYGLRAMNFFVPKWIAMGITTLQIGQMVLAVSLNLYAIYMKSTGVQCERSIEGIKIHFTLYFCYLVLFANYFYKAYMRTAPKAKSA